MINAFNLYNIFYYLKLQKSTINAFNTIIKWYFVIKKRAFISLPNLTFANLAQRTAYVKFGTTFGFAL